MQAQAMAALDSAIKEFHGDPGRLYLTGLSLGGYGTWSIAAEHPGKFAALAPVCGGIRRPRRGAAEQPPENPSTDLFAETAKKIGSTPVWVFHGDADKSVPVTESQKMVEALKAIGGNVKFTEYPGVGHNSWDNAYADDDLWKWLLAHRRPDKS